MSRSPTRPRARFRRILLVLAAVVLVGMCAERFPHTRSRGLWPERVDLLPTPLRGDRRDLPALRDHTKAGLARLKEDTKAHEATEELRLGYVAFTRARHRLVVSSYVWAEGRAGALGPSPFQEARTTESHSDVRTAQ